jgi:diguanylate cyclase (GGDEF)-like protein
VLAGQGVDATAFLRVLDAELARDWSTVAVVRVELDRFYRIRQTWGPQVARSVRAALVSRVQAWVGGSDLILPYGEDALVAVARVADASTAALEALAMRIVDAVSAPIPLPEQPPIAVGCNVGIAAAVAVEGDGALGLLAAADLAVLRATLVGSRRAEVHVAESRADASRLPGLFVDMLGALAEQRFEPLYQAVVSIPDRRIRSAEALVRWQHPRYGTVAPRDFLAEADRSGLIRQIDALVRAAACTACASWTGDRGVAVSVNMAAADFDQPDLAADVIGALRSAGLPGPRLVVEVTEAVLDRNWQRARTRLTELKDAGVRIAVDDLGAGPTYLDRLGSGLVDIVKLDRRLLEPASTGGAGPLLTAVAAGARELGLEVVAKGVETHEQLDAATAAGCTGAQGYLLAAPLATAEFADLLEHGIPG